MGNYPIFPLRWCIAMFPTNAYAQDADMSLSDFEDFVYRACFLDDEDPVACWQELSKQQERYVQWLRGKHASTCAARIPI